MTDGWLRGARGGEDEDLPYCATFGKATIPLASSLPSPLFSRNTSPTELSGWR